MSIQFIELAYLLSAICFIFSLKGLSSPKSARKGSIIGIIGMMMALLATFNIPGFANKTILIAAIVLGGVVGGYIARKIAMTAIPQLIAAFHSFVGLASVLVAYMVYLYPETIGIHTVSGVKLSALIELSIGGVVGMITFSGSLIAFGKLNGNIQSAALQLKGQKYIFLILILSIVVLNIYFVKNDSGWVFLLMMVLSFIIGVFLVLPIGGADMPVVISMLNSYSGLAAAGIGFTLSNSLLIITGALVASSGAILSHIMCAAMNRSLYNVIFGVLNNVSAGSKANTEEKTAKVSSAEDAAFMIEQASSVIIVPGYGMAVAKSQFIIKELVDILKSKGLKVKFAIHPVAGRMPGHMNVLLAEANIDYADVFEMDEINSEFSNTDISLVIGANDITNPAAKTDKDSPVYGMPILDVGLSRTVFFIKRSMSPGYAGIDNNLFFQENSLMLYGDAKKMVEEIVKNLE